MLRTFELIMIAAMLVAATITYTIKYDAERQIAVIAKLKRQIDSEKDTITLLRADWALMTQPGRLQSLVGVYSEELKLQPIEAEQLAMGVQDIPQRQLDDIQKLISGSDELVASGVLVPDATTTGSIKKNGARALIMRLKLGFSKKNKQNLDQGQSLNSGPNLNNGNAPVGNEKLAGNMAFVGSRKKHGNRARNRLWMAIACFVGIYGVIGGKLVYFGVIGGEDDDSNGPAVHQLASRPDILDRNGEILATDIKTSSLFAEPRKIVDPDETIELLSTVIPDLDWEATYRRLKSGAGFVWIKRGLTPRQQSQIMALGVPGIGFRTEKRRFYPGGPTASHVLGLVNVDNQGIAGMEKYIDSQGLSDLRAVGMATGQSLEPVRLSIDIRVQHIMRDVLVKAVDRYRAIAAGAVVLNVKTGEVIAMASVPDFDPNNPVHALDKDRLNRMSAGTYEMGSTIKSFTTAMALDSGKFNLNSRIDASRPLVIGRQTIRDFHGKGRVLTLPEVFIFSSNIGSGHEANVVGIEGHRAFLKKIGLLDRMQTELPEVARPVEPRVWKKVHSMTISFGHGMMTTPLQTAVGAAALMNGGKLIEPTFLTRTQAQADQVAQQVIHPQVSADMRYLYRLNSTAPGGSGKRATVQGYRVGGKTGTAEKVVHGRYSKDVRFNAFLASFPMDDPTYVVLTIIDEPKPEEGKYSATAGLNAAPMVADIIRRSATFLGVKPDFKQEFAPAEAEIASADSIND